MTDQNPVLSDEKVTEPFHTVKDHLQEYRRIPVATYRLQFNHWFTFADATSIVPYLHELGISDCYASPYFKARKGSLHGYDIIDHNSLNPEIGTEKEYNEFVDALKHGRMGQVLDIVPNHMGIADDGNLWWMDVLENGPSSVYANFFDIDWQPVKDELQNKVLLPILGDQYGLVLENQELHLSFEEGSFFIYYYDRRLPVAPTSYKKILRHRIEDLEKDMGMDHPALQELLSILTALDHLPPRTEKDPEKIIERRREKEIVKKRLSNLYREDERTHVFLDENVRIFNGTKGEAGSFDLLDDLLNAQAYRLAHWRVATEEINFRRFFDINELAAIQMENPEVFKEAHRLIFRLIREGRVTGLRVDHPDGLYDPAEYFRWLQMGCFVQFCLRLLPHPAEEAILEEKLAGFYKEEVSKDPASPLRMPLYIVGEKILTKAERMPEDWPIFSTTGYVFLNSVNGIFIQTEHGKVFDDIYTRWIKSKVDYSDLVYEKKKLIIETSMPSEINTLGHILNHISERRRHTRDFTLNSLTTAITEVIAFFPVYRTYATAAGVNERDRRYIEQAVSRAKRKNPSLSETIFDFVETVLLLQYPDDFREEEKKEWQNFVMRFQQITGPVMAKGVEDTAFYVYNRFVSLNEVGGYPERFGTSLETFHGQNIERTKFWPYAMITTMTHDSKRSEDVRARLNVLSEIPEEWRGCLNRWSRTNKKKKSLVDGRRIPDRNEEYLLYQTLVGSWPLHSMDRTEYDLFRSRIAEYMLKAVREAKVNTSWISPNLSYEEHLMKFIRALLTSSERDPFLSDLAKFQERVSYCGMFNSLSQTILKMTCPGIPDFYQGTEIWNFTLVDPDNRRPVDFALRKKMLWELKKRIEEVASDLPGFVRGLVQEWRDGFVKLFVTYRTLNYRIDNQALFLDGSYVPLVAEGTFQNHLCAFARQKNGKSILVVVPRFLTRMIKDVSEMPLGRDVWGETFVLVPDDISGNAFHNIFTGEKIEGIDRNGKRRLPIGQVFANYPVAVLEPL
jgi:(1->4)-alpha-D-glucan 1-alpha-D-glucosylmutase